MRQFGLAPVDLVVCDVFMPNRDGLETIRELCRIKPGVRILAVSGGGQIVPAGHLLATARALGAGGMLAKPFTAAQLLDAVAGQLS